MGAEASRDARYSDAGEIVVVGSGQKSKQEELDPILKKLNELNSVSSPVVK